MMAKKKKSSSHIQHPPAPTPTMAKKKKKSSSHTQQSSAVPIKGNFWTPESKQQFHVAVAQLYDKTELPNGTARGFRGNKLEHGADYVMSPKEELQLADDIAFLFPWEDGAHTVTASTLEEHDDGRRLVIWLGVNKPPPEEVVDKFRDLMRIVESYAIKARDFSRSEAHQELLNKVVEMRSRRIGQRLQSPNGGWRPGRGYEPRHERLARKIAHLEATPEYTMLSEMMRQKFKDICHQLEELFRVYRALDTCPADTNHIHLISAVLASHDLSTQNSALSFLSQLEPFRFQPDDIEVNHILQVDKISHYYTFCTNMIHLARRHRTLFSKIEVKTCHRPPDSKPPGSIETCHVHGEVQLVLHHERAMHQPKPRCLGSSKSLCFLCGLFVEKHGGYWVSHSHKRLYHKWTIPDTDWMNGEQTLRFLKIAREMTVELVRLNAKSRRYVQCPVESRYHLPFWVAPSTASKASSARSVDSDATIRPGTLGSGSLTPVLKGQSDDIGADLKQAISPISDQLSGSTIVRDASSESTQSLSAPPCSRLPPIVEDPSQPALQTPPSPPRPSSPVQNSDSSPQHSSLVPNPNWDPFLQPSSPLSAMPISDAALPPLPSLPLSSSLISNQTTTSPPRSSTANRISSSRSLLSSLPSNLPHTHHFHFRSPELEIAIKDTPFIFDFRTSVIGTLALSWIDMTSTTRPIHFLGGHGICQVVNLAEMNNGVVRLRRQDRRCEFAVDVGGGEVVRVVVVWDDA